MQTRGVSSQRTLAALLVTICSLVTAVGCLGSVALAALAFHSRDRDPPAAAPSGPGKPPAALTAAIGRLATVPGVRLTGTIGAGTPEVQNVDLSVTHEGSLAGTTTRGGERVSVIAVSGATYLKGTERYWNDRRSPNAAQYAGQWVRGRPDELGVDIAAAWAPARLMERLGKATKDGKVGPSRSPGGRTAGTTYTVDGQRVPVDDGLITHMAPAEGVLPAAGDVDLGFDELSLPQSDDVYRRLQQEIGQLRKSVDSAVSFSLNGTGSLAPCTTRSCRANYSLRNDVQSSSPYLTVRRPVRATITIRITLDGRTVRSCVHQRTMAANAAISVNCTATYYIPPARRPRVHPIRAYITARANALVEADVRKLIDDLTQAKQDNPGRPKACPLPADFIPAVSTGEGTARPLPFDRHSGALVVPAYVPSAPRPPKACGVKGLIKKAELPTRGRVRFVPQQGQNANTGLARGTRGGYLDRFGNEWVRGPGRGRNPDGTQREWEWDVQLTPANQRRYKWLCARERRNNITHLNVTPLGEISHVVCQ